jgi:DNA-binding LytR/AlgR family response regulator
MFIQTIIIEDEPLALKKLENFISKVRYLKLAASFDNALDAISYLKQHKINLIFLDIHLEEFTGIQFLEAVNHEAKVIITTAYDKYALKGYEFEVTDYLLKPFTFERFVNAVEKVYKANQVVKHQKSGEFMFVKTEYRLERIDIDDILYIEGMSEYLKIVTHDKKIMTLQSFRSLEDQLHCNVFSRVHKSFLVAINHIESIERGRIKIKDKLIPIGETYRNDFFEKINAL